MKHIAIGEFGTPPPVVPDKNQDNEKQISLRSILNLNPVSAGKIFEQIRWGGAGPTCPRCYSKEWYFIRNRNLYRCADCKRDYTATSGTIFSSHKMPVADLIAACMLFVQSAKGISSLQLSRNLGVNPKTAFVLLHKLREAISRSLETLKLQGTVEIDGCTFGGYRSCENFVRGGFVKRRYYRKFNNRHIVVIARQRLGRTIPFIVKKESEAINDIVAQLDPNAILVSDGAHAWNSLEDLHTLLRIPHNYAYSANNACTNWAESYFSVLRKMHLGVHHKIDKKFMRSYASEIAWKQDFRALSPDEKLLSLLVLALNAPPSKWKGYWQRKRGATHGAN